MTATWDGTGDEPPVGTVLEVGNPGRPWEGKAADLLTFMRLGPHQWVQMHNRAARSMRTVPLSTVRYWAPLRIVTATTSDDYSDYPEHAPALRAAA